MTDWKTPLAERAGWVFSKGKRPSAGEAAVKAVQAKIGALTMERDFLERGLERIHGPKGPPWCAVRIRGPWPVARGPSGCATGTAEVDLLLPATAVA